MRRFLLALCIVLSAGIARATETCSATDHSPFGQLPVCLALDAAASTGAAGTSQIVPTNNYRNLGAQIWSAAGSVATVVVECRSWPTAPWYPCATVTNPTAADPTTGEGGAYISLPRSFQYRMQIIAWTSGSVSATFERYTQ